MTINNFNGTLVLGVRSNENLQFTNILGIRKNANGSYQNILNIVSDNLVAVTNASSVSNPTLPTLILNGITIYSNPATLPTVGATGQIQCYASFTCQNMVSGLTGTGLPGQNPFLPFNTISVDQCFSWNLNINDTGGTWQVNSITNYGTYGNQVTVFGLSGSLTKKAINWSSSSAGYILGGILGPRNFNRELGFLLFGNDPYVPQNVSQFIQNPVFTSLKTHADGARLIANAAGVTLNWCCPDYTLFTFQPQGSQTAGQALASLAAECGGVIRWNGGTEYLACFPNYSIGDWYVPDCCLITSFAQECNQDLNSGIYSPGVYLVPQLGAFDSGTASIISAYGAQGGVNGQGLAAAPTTQPSTTTPSQLLVAGSPAIEPPSVIYQSNTLMTSSSPAQVVPLDFDTENIYIQNVTVSDFTGPYTTPDPNFWSLLSSGLSSSFVTWKDIGGKIQPQLNLEPAMFPVANSDASNNNWYLRIGVTKIKAPVNVTDTATGSLALTLMRYKWIPICTGSVSCVFFGSIPVPGMTLHATLNNTTITGIIESVSFTSPGILNVNFVKWAELNYYTQLGNSDSTKLPGFPQG